MSTKTPFEIRLDILKMARDLVMEEMYIKRDYNTELWQASDRKGILTWPEFPDNDKILEKAKELYEFVAPGERNRRQSENM